MALVIGNGDYEGRQADTSGRLDAEAIAKVLGELNFETRILPDMTKEELLPEIAAFMKSIQGASVVAFFSSGHGFQSDGENFLLPKRADVSRAGAISLDNIVQDLINAQAALKFVFVDACREDTKLPDGLKPGLAEPRGAPKNVIQAFATPPGQVAKSGAPGELSPFTKALVRSLKIPGLPVKNVFAHVRADVDWFSDGLQAPTVTDLDKVPDTFFFRDPVLLQAAIEKPDDDLLVVLNSRTVIDGARAGRGPQALPLLPETNYLTLFVSNAKTFHNGQSWAAPEGWSYALHLYGPGGAELTDPDCREGKGCFADHEEVPFKDGPHHGGVFMAERAELYVDPVSATVELRRLERGLWESEAPFIARQQELLFCKSLGDLPLRSVPGLKRYLTIVDFSRKVLGVIGLLPAVKFPDLNKLFAQVRGNGALRGLVDHCMNDPEELKARLAEAADSVDAALEGAPRPFDAFDSKLSECVRNAADEDLKKELGSDLKVVATNFEDGTNEAEIEQECRSSGR